MTFALVWWTWKEKSNTQFSMFRCLNSYHAAGDRSKISNYFGFITIFGINIGSAFK